MSRVSTKNITSSDQFLLFLCGWPTSSLTSVPQGPRIHNENHWAVTVVGIACGKGGRWCQVNTTCPSAAGNSCEHKAVNWVRLRMNICLTGLIMIMCKQCSLSRSGVYQKRDISVCVCWRGCMCVYTVRTTCMHAVPSRTISMYFLLQDPAKNVNPCTWSFHKSKSKVYFFNDYFGAKGPVL